MGSFSKNHKKKNVLLTILIIHLLVVLPLFMVLINSRNIEFCIRDFQSESGYKTCFNESSNQEQESIWEILETFSYYKSTQSILDVDEIFLRSIFFLLGLSIGDIFLVITNSSNEVSEKKYKSTDNFDSISIEITLTELEKTILEMIRDHLDDNRPLVIHDARNYVMSRISKQDLNINTVGVQKTLNSLISKGIISEGSTLTRGDILENENRKEIYNFIANNPGVYSSQIVRELDISRYSVDWHISKLVEFNFIRKYRINNFAVYATIETPQKIVKLNHFVTKHKSRQILELLTKKNTGLSIYKISKELEIHHTTVGKYIHRFLELDIVKETKDSSASCIYSLTGATSNLIRKR